MLTSAHYCHTCERYTLPCNCGCGLCGKCLFSYEHRPVTYFMKNEDDVNNYNSSISNTAISLLRAEMQPANDRLNAVERGLQDVKAVAQAAVASNNQRDSSITLLTDIADTQKDTLQAVVETIEGYRCAITNHRECIVQLQDTVDQLTERIKYIEDEQFPLVTHYYNPHTPYGGRQLRYFLMLEQHPDGSNVIGSEYLAYDTGIVDGDGMMVPAFGEHFDGDYATDEQIVKLHITSGVVRDIRCSYFTEGGKLYESYEIFLEPVYERAEM